MGSDSGAGISESNKALKLNTQPDLANQITEVANFALNDDDEERQQSAFKAFQSEPPPAPKLHSQGVIAMDITEQFINAAQGRIVGWVSPAGLISRVNCIRARPGTIDQRSIFHSV